MADNRYDVIVVGARCAGSPIAMLLARKGYRVLVVDRDTFPSDTLSTHLIHPPGVKLLARWGLLDRLIATGCPPIANYTLDFGPVSITGSPGDDATPHAYAPRRTVLDKLLVDAAAEAGAEIREGFSVDELVSEDGRVGGIRGRDRTGATVTERARVVIGADGRHSFVARHVRPETYNEKPPLLAAYYSYWSDLPTSGFETYVRPMRSWAAWPTHDDLTLVIAGWPYAEFAANKGDVEGNTMRMFEMAPAFDERIRQARRVERFVGTAVPNYFRRPFGPGWALVGDAGYNKDFITAQGMQDAFRDAELLATALDRWFTGAEPFESAMATYQSTRDASSMAMYEFTAMLATLEPPPPPLEALIAAMQGHPEPMRAFTRVIAGVTSPADFFSEENVGRIMNA